MGCQTWTATHLSQRFSEVLPLPHDVRLRVYHISTPAIPASTLFTPAPGKQEEKTHCERHFLAVSIPSGAQWLLGFAIEVLIFTTTTLTTIFVSKADSSGYLYTGDVPDKRDISKTMTSTFLQHLLEARPASLKTVLSLFAKSQNQYLFPGSSEYPGKRLLPDRKLLRWWCGVPRPSLAIRKQWRYRPRHGSRCRCSGMERRASFKYSFGCCRTAKVELVIPFVANRAGPFCATAKFDTTPPRRSQSEISGGSG